MVLVVLAAGIGAGAMVYRSRMALRESDADSALSDTDDQQDVPDSDDEDSDDSPDDDDDPPTDDDRDDYDALRYDMPRGN